MAKNTLKSKMLSKRNKIRKLHPGLDSKSQFHFKSFEAVSLGNCEKKRENNMTPDGCLQCQQWEISDFYRLLSRQKGFISPPPWTNVCGQNISKTKYGRKLKLQLSQLGPNMYWLYKNNCKENRLNNIFHNWKQQPCTEWIFAIFRVFHHNGSCNTFELEYQKVMRRFTLVIYSMLVVNEELIR